MITVSSLHLFFKSWKASLDRPWEECRGIGESFGYNRNENLEQYASSEKLIHMLINIVSGGGNLLLNIGPAADGSIPVIMQQRLKNMGDWLKVNGEAIYETTAWEESPKNKPTDVFFTRKGNDLYVIATKWKDIIEVEGIKNAMKVSMPGYIGTVQFKKEAGNLLITAPELNKGNMPVQYAWIYKITGAF